MAIFLLCLHSTMRDVRSEKGSAEEKRLAMEEYRTAVQLNPSRASLKPRLGKLAREIVD